MRGCFLLAASLMLAAVACGDGDETPLATPPGEVREPFHDNSESHYAETGTPPVADWDLVCDYRALSGEFGGFELIRWDDYEHQNRCEAGSHDYLRFDPWVDLFQLGYMPAGLFERTPQYAAICLDESTHSVAQYFTDLDEVQIIIAFERNDRKLEHRAIHKAATTTVRGETALILDPWDSRREGDSWFAVPRGDGFFRMWTSGLPYDEALNILEALECEDC